MSFQLPFNKKQIVEELKRRQTMPENPSPELIKYSLEFNKFYEQIDEFAMFVLELFCLELEKINIFPTRLIFALVGGRIYGKPLDLDSDIDFIIGVEEQIPIPLNFYDISKVRSHNIEISRRWIREFSSNELISRKFKNLSNINWFEFKGVYLISEIAQRYKEEDDVLPICELIKR